MLLRSAAAALFVLASAASARQAAPVVDLAPRSARDTVPVPADTTTRAPAADSSRVREYRGAYSSGFEMSWFEPCDATAGDALWWVTLTEDARLQRDSLIKLLPRRPTEGLIVRWRGTVSPKMRGGAGQMGRGSRYMLVTRILSVQALTSNGACGPTRVS